jgi:xanthine dehydrogenase accessory factor
MRELLPTVRAWRAQGIEPIGRAVVVRTFHSSPRQPGATLLVADGGRVAGSVSGGCVEGAASEEVRRAHADRRSRIVRYGISDDLAWDVGLACGGSVEVLLEPLLRPELVEAAEATERGEPVRALLIPLPGDAPVPAQPAQLVTDATGAVREALSTGSSRTIETDAGALFIEVLAPAPRLVVVGAVHIAIPLVRYARELGWRTVVVDRRATFASAERFPDVDRLLLEWPERAAEAIGLGPDDAVAVLSHDPKLDEPAIVEALRRGCRYVGAIGSRRTQAGRRARLLAAGLDDGQLARLHGPIGLDLGAVSPAEVALAAMAEIVAVWRGGSGGSLSPVATGKGG